MIKRIWTWMKKQLRRVRQLWKNRQDQRQRRDADSRPTVTRRRPQTGGITEKQTVAQGVQQFIDQHYELRYNLIKQTEEFRPRHSGHDGTAGNGQWQQLTDRELRRISFEQMKEVGVAWNIDVELYVRSAMVPAYNPVSDFLGRCGTWDGHTDHIGQLARRVPTAYKQWPDLFHRWLLAMVAQWLQMGRDHGNSLVPMLIGRQGTRKSTFCKLLLPPELRDYYLDDIKMDNAEQVERVLGRMLLVNVDEYNAKTEREQAKIKRVLTERDVQTRRMRSDQYQRLPRMASFIATTNDPQPLCDPTGSRRYLCCEVDGTIDTDTPIDHRQLYAQAVYELRHGARWHLTRDEEAALEEHNTAYRVETPPEQVLTAWYEPAPRHKDNFVRTVDIAGELSRRVGKQDLPTIAALTATLRACGFPYGAIAGRRGWYARLRC